MILLFSWIGERYTSLIRTMLYSLKLSNTAQKKKIFVVICSAYFYTYTLVIFLTFFWYLLRFSYFMNYDRELFRWKNNAYQIRLPFHFHNLFCSVNNDSRYHRTPWKADKMINFEKVNFNWSSISNITIFQLYRLSAMTCKHWNQIQLIYHHLQCVK